MLRYLISFLVTMTLIFTLAGCGGKKETPEKIGKVDPPVKTDKDHLFPEKKRVEAREWFTNHKPGLFAGNRFETVEEGRQFMEKLYSIGCQMVFVLGPYDDPETIKEWGGPIANSFIIVLPQDKAKRKVIFDLQEKEAEEDGYIGMPDTGQKELLFWWD